MMDQPRTADLLSPERRAQITHLYPTPWSVREGYQRSLIVGNYEGVTFRIVDANGNQLFQIRSSEGGALAEFIVALVNAS